MLHYLHWQTVILGIFDEASNDVKGRRQIAFVMLSGVLVIKFYPPPSSPLAAFTQ